MARIAVTGAGGMIGGFLVKTLVEEGNDVTAVDIKQLHKWQQKTLLARNVQGDMRDLATARAVLAGTDACYAIACDMGGIGHIETHRADCILSTLITATTVKAAVEVGVPRLFYSSSACVYNATKQKDTDVTALREEDAYPMDSEAGYGEEKFLGERICEYAGQDYNIETRIARYHNIYSGGPTSWNDGREKAPAAICRKVAIASIHGPKVIDIWGDGHQTRSFAWIDDCIYGTKALMNSDYRKPLNIGSSELVSINQLVDIVEDIAGVKLTRNYDLTAPTGVRGRNSDNTLCKEVLNWEPNTPLRTGLERLYPWIYDQIAKSI